MAAPVATYHQFLTGRLGFSPIASVGILGNIEQESGFDPGAFNPDEGAEGLAQWRLDRRDAMRRHVARSDLPPALAQLDFLSKEVDQHKGLRQRLNAAKSPEEAAQVFAKEYERPKVIEQSRLSNARNLYAGLADPEHRAARGMVAQAGASDAAPAPKRLKLSDVMGDEPRAAPPKRLRLSDIMGEGGAPAKPAEEPLPPPASGQDYVTGGTMEGGEGAVPPAAPTKSWFAQGVDDLTRGFRALPGIAQVDAAKAAAMGYAVDRLTGKETPRGFQDLYRENLAKEEAANAAAAARPGLGGVDLPFGLGRININANLAGNILGGAVVGRLLPTFGAEKLPFVGGMASGAVQGGEAALMQLMAGMAGNAASGDAAFPPKPQDIQQALGFFGGGVAGGVTADALKQVASPIARRLMVETPDLRRSPKAADQILDKFGEQYAKAPGPRPALQALADEFASGQTPPREMIIDRPGAEATRVVLRGNANAEPAGQARLRPLQRFAQRQEAIAADRTGWLNDVFDGDLRQAQARLRAERDARATYLYEQAGLPRIDPALDLDAQRQVVAQAPTVPTTKEFQQLRADPQFQRMARTIRRDPLFRDFPDNNLAVLDQVYKLFNAGVDPKSGNRSQAYAQTGRTLKSMVAKAISADPDFQPGQAYAQAVRQFADDSQILDATALGESVGKWSDNHYREIGRMTAPEREAVRMGVASKVRLDLEGKTPQQAATYLAKGPLRRDLATAFGKEDAAAFLDQVRETYRQRQNNTLINQGSNTTDKASEVMAVSDIPVTSAGVLSRTAQEALRRLRPKPGLAPRGESHRAIANDLLTREDAAANARVLQDLIRLGQIREAQRFGRRMLPATGLMMLGDEHVGR